MFITKLSSKQKQLKMVQEIQHRQSNTAQLARRGDLLAMASSQQNNSRGELGYSLKASKTG